MTSNNRDEIRYIDPLSDFGFKKLFREEVNKEILIEFLNVVFPEYNIKDITYLNAEQLGASKDDRKVLFDILCKAKDGKEFIVEMQKGNQAHFHERALYYSAFPLTKQGKVGVQKKPNGKSATWDFNIDGVYFLGIENFIDVDDNEIIHRYSLKEETTGQLFTDKLRFVTIEIPKFQKTDTELETKMDKWLFLLKNLPRLLDRPAALRDRIFSRIFDVVDFSDLDDEEQQNYRQAMDTWLDTQLMLDYAEKNGERKGIKDGIISVAKNLLKMGTSSEDVAKATGLSVEELKKIATN